MEPPIKPDESQCCNSGCNPCIFDVYEEQLKKYQKWLDDPRRSQNQQKNCIDSIYYKKFELIDRIQHTEDAWLFIFQYHDTDECCNGIYYEPGQYLLLRSPKERGEEFTRAYTPITMKRPSKISFTILVRLYENGRMSKYLNRLKVGDYTEWRGPYGDFTLDLKLKYQVFIAQGTAIAPIFEILQKLIHNDDCESFTYLFYCCRNYNNIMLRDELCNLRLYWNFNYNIFISDTTNYNSRYQEPIQQHKLQANDLEEYLKDKVEAKVMICGSEIFNKAMESVVKNCGISDIHLF